MIIILKVTNMWVQYRDEFGHNKANLGNFNSWVCPSNFTHSNHWVFSQNDLEIIWMTLKNNRVPLLGYIKICALLQSHQLIQTWVIVRKCSIQVKIGNFLSRVTLKFDRGHWNIIGHLFYATWSFVPHFAAISQFKLELKSRNAKIGWKSAILLFHVTMKFNAWP